MTEYNGKIERERERDREKKEGWKEGRKEGKEGAHHLINTVQMGWPGPSAGLLFRSVAMS